MANFIEFLEQLNVTFLLQYPYFLTILATIFILLFTWFSTTPTNKKNSPPSPPKLPIIGNLHQLGVFPHRSLYALAKRHGPYMLLHFGRKPVLVISSADAAREVLKTNDLVFSNRPKSTMFEKLLYQYRDVALARYGEYWRQMKSICVLHLLSNKRVQTFRDVREEETAAMIEKIKLSHSSSEVVNLTEVLVTITNDIACRVALGRKYSGGGEKFKRLLGEIMALLGTVVVGDYFPWLTWVGRVNGLNARAEKAAKELDDFLNGVVAEHLNVQKKGSTDGSVSLENEEKKDLVDIMLWIQKENVIGFPIDELSIKAITMDMFAAGTDTTHTALEWAMAELFRHPNVMKKLQNEVREIAGNKKTITEDNLNKMHYLKAVIKETLRLHPPLPLLVPRESTQDVKVQGYDIATGTQILVNAWAIGRDPTKWDEPEQFRPERFLTSSVDFKGHNYELIPFGAGRRGCPGISFAIIVNELVLANLVHNFDWTLPGGVRVEDLDITEGAGMTIYKKYPIKAIATPHFA